MSNESLERLLGDSDSVQDQFWPVAADVRLDQLVADLSDLSSLARAARQRLVRRSTILRPDPGETFVGATARAHLPCRRSL